jgi:hypothetical protein
MSELIREWISCNSPLLLVAKDHLDAWEGSAVPAEGRNVEARFRWNPDGPATDYDRACDVDDFVGLIDVGPGKALVLGDEPLMTTWLPLKDGGVLVRWVCADDEEALLAAAHHIPNEDYQDSGLSFTVGDSPLVLLAACESSEDTIYPRIEFEIPPGRYRILTSQYDADASTSLICHRLQVDVDSP